ncbi:CDP-alcohol phosphatidyltransferase family protein [Flavobacteriaceae bacterium]|nr:CDP-alcohol phosphatidyltransferase family protein [Flavobacteriaceae bacterium]
MAKVTYQQVKDKCTKGRFFAYDSIHDKIFVPPSIFLVWLFLRLGFSGNGVSVLSGFLAIIGGVLIASNDPLFIFIGSFGYMAFYLLDYVDGGVARFNDKSGAGGQYMDWIMHVVSCVSIMTGLFIGAFSNTGLWLIPFGVLAVVASALSFDRYSFAWFAICMHRQQLTSKGTANKPLKEVKNIKKKSLFFRALLKICGLIFHENYLIFSLPIVAFLNFYIFDFLDLRVVFIILGGVLYFPIMLYDVWRLASSGIVDVAYNKLFFSKEKPKLPDDHFLNL